MLFSDNSLRLSTNYSKDAVCSFTLYNVFCSAFNLCTSWVVERSLSLITIRIPHCCIHVKLWTLQGSVSYASEWIMCNWAMELSGKTIYSFAFIAQKKTHDAPPQVIHSPISMLLSMLSTGFSTGGERTHRHRSTLGHPIVHGRSPRRMS